MKKPANPQLRAAWEVHKFFTRAKIPYSIIGGIAVQHWGEPRFTRDVDVTVIIPAGQEEAVLRRLFSVFRPRINDALDFALKHRVCLLQSSDGYDIDISLGLPGYEDHLLSRSVDYAVGGGRLIKICSPEDLIIHKAVAGRAQDLSDIEGIIVRQGKTLDRRYVMAWLKEFARATETPEIVRRFEEPWKRLQKCQG